MTSDYRLAEDLDPRYELLANDHDLSVKFVHGCGDWGIVALSDGTSEWPARVVWYPIGETEESNNDHPGLIQFAPENGSLPQPEWVAERFPQFGFLLGRVAETLDNLREQYVEQELCE